MELLCKIRKRSALLGFSNEIVVMLEEEQGDRYSGTPTVTLGLDSEGKVAAASYEAPTALLGFGDVAFAPAVKQFHIVEFILAKVGLTEVEIGGVKLPGFFRIFYLRI